MTMKHYVGLLMATALLTIGLAIGPDRLAAGGAKGNASDRAQVVRFFKEHVIGKKLATPVTTYSAENNKLQGSRDSCDSNQ